MKTVESGSGHAETENTEDICTGELFRKCPRRVLGKRTWQKRYFVMNNAKKTLAYFTNSRGTSTPIGVIPLQAVSDVRNAEEGKKRHKQRFIITLKGDWSFELRASSRAEKERWMLAIRDNIKSIDFRGIIDPFKHEKYWKSPFYLKIEKKLDEVRKKAKKFLDADAKKAVKDSDQRKTLAREVTSAVETYSGCNSRAHSRSVSRSHKHSRKASSHRDVSPLQSPGASLLAGTLVHPSGLALKNTAYHQHQHHQHQHHHHQHHHHHRAHPRSGKTSTNTSSIGNETGLSRTTGGYYPNTGINGRPRLSVIHSEGTSLADMGKKSGRGEQGKAGDLPSADAKEMKGGSTPASVEDVSQVRKHGCITTSPHPTPIPSATRRPATAQQRSQRVVARRLIGSEEIEICASPPSAGNDDDDDDDDDCHSDENNNRGLQKRRGNLTKSSQGASRDKKSRGINQKLQEAASRGGRKNAAETRRQRPGIDINSGPTETPFPVYHPAATSPKRRSGSPASTSNAKRRVTRKSLKNLCFEQQHHRTRDSGSLADSKSSLGAYPRSRTSAEMKSLKSIRPRSQPSRSNQSSPLNKMFSLSRITPWSLFGAATAEEGGNTRGGAGTRVAQGDRGNRQRGERQSSILDQGLNSGVLSMDLTERAFLRGRGRLLHRRSVSSMARIDVAGGRQGSYQPNLSKIFCESVDSLMSTARLQDALPQYQSSTSVGVGTEAMMKNSQTRKQHRGTLVQDIDYVLNGLPNQGRERQILPTLASGRDAMGSERGVTA